MTKYTINVGSAANDGTGDSIRGAFQNVNNNFTEVYNNIGNIAVTLTLSYDKANSANLLAYNTGIGANGWANAVGVAGNSYTDTIAATNRGYTNTSAIISNTWANTVGSSGNTYALNLVTAANSNAVISIASANAWTNAVSTAGNNYTNAVGAAGNNYTVSIGAASNTWANSVNSYAISSFYTIANGIAAFAKANNAYANTTGTLVGTLTVTGTINDIIGPLREKLTSTVNSNTSITVSESIVIANNSNTIYINIENDGKFLFTPNTGTSIEIYQYGSGNTAIRANDAFVTVVSSNNWANIAGQYLSASLIKIKSNTWMLTGNLKA